MVTVVTGEVRAPGENTIETVTKDFLWCTTYLELKPFVYSFVCVHNLGVVIMIELWWVYKL